MNKAYGDLTNWNLDKMSKYKLFQMVQTVGQYRILNRTKVSGKIILHLFSNSLLSSTFFLDFRYTTRANSNMKKLT